MAWCVAAARQSFKEQEALVYQQLAQLIRDAVWLKSYIAAVMRLEQEAFQSAYASLGPSKATLPLQQEVPMQSEQMMMTTGATASRPIELQPQVYCGATELLAKYRILVCHCSVQCQASILELALSSYNVCKS